MLLASSFGVFVKSLGARPYLATKIEGFDLPDASNMFGLGGIYNEDSEELRITIGQVDGGLDFRLVDSCVLGIYRSVDAGSDYLINEVEVTAEYLKKSAGKYYWEISTRIQVPSSSVMLGAVVYSAGSQYAAWTPIESEERSKQVRYYTEKFRTSLDVLPEDQPHTVVLVTDDATPRELVRLDFHNDNPVLLGSGSLEYTGGGNRYLPTYEGIAEPQARNQKPWSMGCSLFVEAESSNILHDSELALSTWKHTGSSRIITNHGIAQLPSFPNHNALVFSVSGSSSLDAYWEFETEVVATTNTTHTASLYFQTIQRSSRVFGTEIGLRIYDANKTILRETKIDLDPNSLQDLELRYVTDHVQTPSSDSRFASLYVRVRDLCPGDRFEATLAIPQIETMPTASSRIANSSVREADNVTWIPDDGTYDDTCGRFDISFYPAYSGIPGSLGDQFLFDTRDVTDEYGFYCYHNSSGFIVFGMTGETTSETWEIASSSVMHFTYGKVVTLTCWFDKNTLRIDLDSLKIMTHVFANAFSVPDIPRIRLGRDNKNSNHMNGELLSFCLSTDPLNED